MEQTADLPNQRLEHYPVTFFAIGMGMLGLTLALHAAEVAFALSAMASHIALALSLLTLAVVSLGYLLKALRHPNAVAEEWHHPIRIAFFPAISISLLLTSIALMAEFPGIARPVWIVGTALQGVLALSVIASWIGHRPFKPGQLTPAWFIPAVGNVIVPIAGVHLGYTEISWLFYSAGLMFWIVLLTLVMNRLMFHDPLPGKMVPTLMILVAPPSVAFISWVQLTGEAGSFGHILLNLGYVFTLLVVTQIGKLVKLPFAMSWWALSFPIASLSIASFRYGNIAQSDAHLMIGAGLLALLLAVVAGLILRTLLAISRSEICLPE